MITDAAILTDIAFVYIENSWKETAGGGPSPTGNSAAKLIYIMAFCANLRNHRYTARQPCSESSIELPMRKITRREFLLRTASLTAACEASRYLAWARSASADAWPTVAVAKGRNTDSAADILKTALDGIGGIGRFVKPGQTVAIKPNATWAYPPGTASSTEPDVLAALILLVREAGAKRIIVMDRSTLWTTAEALQVSGLGKVVDGLGGGKALPRRLSGAGPHVHYGRLPQREDRRFPQDTDPQGRGRGRSCASIWPWRRAIWSRNSPCASST